MSTPERIIALDPGFITRVGQGLAYAFTGKGPGWMGPGVPIQPILSTEDQASVKGRQYDFPVAQNLTWRPGSTKGISFETLRGLADSLDILRLIIETRKDQMESQKFSIKKRDGSDAGDRGKKIMDFLESPDRVHTWTQWQRALLEDYFVIDAPVIYPRKTLGGDLYSLELIDGATISLMLGADGRRPVEGPAYQQVLKGVVAAEFGADELIYGMSNWRSNRLYGYSRVEQIIVTINVALHRQLFQLQMFTEGSKPDLVFRCPKEWSPDQIQMYSDWWNGQLAGKPANKRKTLFVPDGVEPYNLKQDVLKDALDEWVAMICCYAFSVSPQPFIKMMNKATAQTAQETAVQEGLFPIQRWLKGILDRIVRDCFDCPDLEAVWENEKEIDPKVRAEIHKTYIDAGVLEIDEVRDQIGLDPLPVEAPAAPENVSGTALQGPQIQSLQALLESVASKQLPKASVVALIRAAFPTLDEALVNSMVNGLDNFTPEPPANPTPPAPGSPTDAPSGPDRVAAGGEPVAGNRNPKADGGGGDAPAKALGSHLTKAKAYADPNRPKVKAARAKFSGKLKTVFRKLAVQVSDAVIKAVAADKMTKGEPSMEELEALLAQVIEGGFASLNAYSQSVFMEIFQDGAEGALERLSGYASEAAIATSTDLVHSRAVEWSRVRSAELITEIEKTTMERIRADVTEALSEGHYTEDLADKLMESYGFSDARAEMVARTELARADSAGNMAAYRDSGVVAKKTWLRADAADDCPICEGNQDQGEIALDEAFESGDDAPPGHPNCLCVVIPILSEIKE